ncbi:hypothetical protein OESDEN_20985 [Oesophagostomum dentatum]|uniref:SLC12A transporter C-terminal domain-containing protein n=1 Tax=Oesophagostomum dentatum TaxID=61180 RepID=A0A0B1S349_OESDE|nr:hypothetical protein OESDEN_20985 [Oesophagostomum dentatum]
MAALLKKFRIDATDLNVINTFGRPPKRETITEFNRYVTNIKEDNSGQRGLINEVGTFSA